MKKEKDYLHKFYTTKLGNGKNLLEITTYKGISMWWFVDLKFYLFINKILNGTFDDKLNHTKPIFLLYKRIGLYLDVLLEVLVRILVNGIHKRSNKNYRNNVPRILFSAPDINWRVVRDYVTKEIKKSDALFDPVIKKLNSNYRLIGVYPIIFINSLKVLADKVKNWDIPHKPFDIYWSLDAWKKEKEAFKYFREVWENLKDDEIFKELCVYNGKSLYEPIKRELELYFYVLFPLAVKYIEMAKRMIEIENPDLILVENEYGIFERALVIAAKLKGIPVLAIQHGVIHPYHRGYMHAKNEISPKGSVRSPYCPIPDKTAVYGEYYKELLTKVSAYPEDSVVVTGQPRYDILYYANEIYSREEFLKKYKINPENKIILWTTQSHGLSYKENIKNLKAIFNTMQELKNVTLVIKQHPGEREEHTKLIKKYLNKYKNVDAVLVPKDADTYELLFFCDLLIVRHSTTAMEAVALNKPVIVLNLSGEPDGVDYVEEGVALGVYKEEDLKSAIEKLLNDDSELAKNRRQYIEKHLYKIDGKATERVVNLITQMIKEGRGKDEK